MWRTIQERTNNAVWRKNQDQDGVSSDISDSDSD